ncbi:Vinorine synthase [Camellia lanceoleosa]|uniref:Vinorine synthase n=1 Tax=Camellia lanceoleosa TaxID=1840588 RepID=A0ACC0H3G0_9ERIC|nr:Vinorine synthase [Camellia lanceoleosa]
MEIKFEIIGRETIKPYSPTPHHLRRYKLSSRDQFSPQQYIPVVFFYINPSHTTRGSGIDGGGESYDETANVRSEHLKESLSKTLTHFYPLAGRLRDNLSVDCNDEGANYLEARVTNCRVSNILERLDVEEMYQLFTTIPTDVYNSPLLLVQVNFFQCGGMAVCVSISHKIVDGVAFSAFVKAWSCITRGSHDPVVPDFSAASSRFPPIEDFPMPSIVFPQISQKIVSRRSYALGMSPAPSPRTYALTGAVNLRPRLMPPLPKYSFGNVSGLLWAMLDNNKDEITDLPDLVCQLRKGIEQSTNNNFTTKATYLMRAKKDEMDVYCHSSWCRFPLYEVDFGWGNPTYVVPVLMGAPIGIRLQDTRDGDGVEVWMTLKEEDMALFQGDQELLAYASPNPSAL